MEQKPSWAVQYGAVCVRVRSTSPTDSQADLEFAGARLAHDDSQGHLQGMDEHKNFQTGHTGQVGYKHETILDDVDSVRSAIGESSVVAIGVCSGLRDAKWHD